LGARRSVQEELLPGAAGLDSRDPAIAEVLLEIRHDLGNCSNPKGAISVDELRATVCSAAKRMR
jgi:hypothetical protein